VEKGDVTRQSALFFNFHLPFFPIPINRLKTLVIKN
jgi:hypothetical protein